MEIKTLNIDEQKEIFSQFIKVVGDIEDEAYSDCDSQEWADLKERVKPHIHAIFYGAHFTLYKDRPEFGSFYINPPVPFEDESYWEDLASFILNVFEGDYEKSYFYPDEHIEQADKQIERRLALYQTLLALGAMPDNDSFGYEEWLESIPKVDGKPQFPKVVRLNNFRFERYEKQLAKEKAGLLESWEKRTDYCAWNKKAEISKSLQSIVANTPVLDLRDPATLQLFTEGDIYKVSAFLNVVAERQELDKNIQPVAENADLSQKQTAKTNSKI